MQYLCSYKPLISSAKGRHAATFNLPPFINGSCRREPDFECQFPSISALCRFKMFAPRLHPNDSIAYITIKGKYLGVHQEHWRLTAILKVIERFTSHEDAAKWYNTRGIVIPNNCMVDGNRPMPFEKTHRKLPKHLIKRKKCWDNKKLVRFWDAIYRYRTRNCGIFLVCEAEFLELQEPPILTKEGMKEIFGRIRVTKNPLSISKDEFRSLRTLTE